MKPRKETGSKNVQFQGMEPEAADTEVDAGPLDKQSRKKLGPKQGSKKRKTEDMARAT